MSTSSAASTFRDNCRLLRWVAPWSRQSRLRRTSRLVCRPFPPPCPACSGVELTAGLSRCVAEYALFLSPSFDPNSFAHALVNNEPYPPPTASSSSPSPLVASSGSVLSDAQSKVVLPKNLGGGGSGGEAMLNFGVEDLNRQLKLEVRAFWTRMREQN